MKKNILLAAFFSVLVISAVRNTNTLGEYQQNQPTNPVAKLAIVPGKNPETSEILNLPDVIDPNAALTAPLMSNKDFPAGKKQFMKEARSADDKNKSGLAIFLIVLLLFAAGSGIWFLSLGASSGVSGVVLIGLIIAGLSIFGIVKLVKYYLRVNRVKES